MKRMIYIIAAVVMLTGCRRGAEWRNSEGAAWGTVYHITYLADRPLDDSIIATMQRVNMSLSMFEPQSTVSRINRGESRQVDSMTAEVYRISRRVWALSGGYFDPTVRPLVDLWGFSTKGERPYPDSASVEESLALVGMEHTCLVGDTLTLDREGISLDFSAVAKGYGVDCIAATLRRNGCTDFMVEVGGEVSVSGLNPRGELWRIMVENPADSLDMEPVILHLDNECVATSGNYRNYRVDADGRRYAHTFNPHTGYPQQGKYLSVTVIARTCGEADALATAAMAMPADSIATMISKVPGARVLAIDSELQLVTIGQ